MTPTSTAAAMATSFHLVGEAGRPEVEGAVRDSTLPEAVGWAQGLQASQDLPVRGAEGGVLLGRLLRLVLTVELGALSP